MHFNIKTLANMGSLYIVLLSLCVSQVHSMALKGPVLTRYQPCGLGVIYFDKITDILWRAEINLESYRNLQQVKIEINFEKEMTLYGVSQNSTVIITNNSRNFTFTPKGDIPVIYHIYMSINENKTTSLPVVKIFILNDMLLCNDFLKAAETIASFDVTSDDKEHRHICGRRNLNHSEVNLMRTDAEPGDWPWHVAILIKKPFSDLAQYQCGGNVISRTAILTAGHCVFLNDSLVETSRFVIVAGVTNLKNQVYQPGKQIRIAQRIILHPGYSPEYATSDLAIVVVNTLMFTEYVQPICVWGPVYEKTALFGKQAVTMGFGTTEQNVLSETLRSTNIIIQNDTTCIAYSPNLYTKLINEFTFCAGFGPTLGINPRNGDSGGGVIVPTEQEDHKVTWFLRGILSKCGLPTGQLICDPKFYVIYTDVGPHYGWIYHNAGLVFSNNIVS